MAIKCKSKKCQRILPDGYKYKYCEHCRNKRSDTIRNIRNCVGGIGLIALAIVTKGKINPKGKS